jgi:secreted PhoX family phosphatase
VRWNETGGDPAATSFRWNIFALAGDRANSDPTKRGNIRGDSYGSPDGLWIDDRGILWIQTDISTGSLNTGDYANIGNNMMLAADPATGETRRFLTGPRGCEVTGVVTTPDGRSMFVSIQHRRSRAPATTARTLPRPSTAGPTGRASAARARRPS